MKKKWLILFPILLILLGIWLQRPTTSKVVLNQSAHIKTQQKKYFYPLAIEKFTKAKQPCVPIELNKKN